MSEEKIDEAKLKLVHEKLLGLAMKKGSINEDDIYFSLLKVGENADGIQKFIQSLSKKGVKIIKSSDELFKNIFTIVHKITPNKAINK